ncbi:hypothetical protein [Winogradskyella sp. PC D3.3]
MGREYRWKNFTENKYVDLVEELTQINVYNISSDIKFDETFHSLCLLFSKEYSTFKIPLVVEKKLGELFLRFNIEKFKPQMRIIGCALQDSYSNNFGIVKDDLLNDFDTNFKDFKELLEVLKEYLYSENLKRMPDVSFKTMTNGTTNIKNFFVKLDIYEALCSGFDLTKENYEARSQELLNKTNKIILHKYAEKVKVDFIQGIHKYLVSNNLLDTSNSLKFIGVFFKYFQVKINNSKVEFELYDTLEDNIKSLDLKNLNHYLTRPRKLFHY